MSKFARWFACFTFGHQFTVWQELSDHSRRVVCPRCLKSWGMNDPTRSFIDWTPELEEMYRDIFRIPIRPWNKTVTPTRHSESISEGRKGER